MFMFMKCKYSHAAIAAMQPLQPLQPCSHAAMQLCSYAAIAAFSIDRKITF
jgi:hypothetical protein